jgi:25S rRNA (uracil2634-N3)-methyltransferase
MGKGKPKRGGKGHKGGSPHDHASHARSSISKKQKKKQQRQRQNHEQADDSFTDGSPREPKVPSGGCPYSSQKTTLLLGEGDFSFGAALALVWGNASNLTATVYDEEAVALQKYASLAENMETIRSLGGTVLFGVDAGKASAQKAVRNRGPFDRIIFNFPHTGSGIKDQKRNVLQNQDLLRSSFHSCSSLLNAGGEFHLTLKKGEPYSSWNTVVIGKMSGYKVHHCTPFRPELFPGYAHKRTIGDEHAGVGVGPNAEIAGARTYAFVQL